MELKVLKTKCNLMLPDHLDAYQAQDLKDALLKALSSKKALSINAQDVERINTTCAQILAASKLAFDNKNLKMKIENPTEPVLHQLMLIGLLDALSLKESV